MKSTEPNQNQRAAEARVFQPSIFQSPQRRRLIGCLLLVLATLALYSPVTRAPFLNYDDSVYVTDNAQVRAGLTWSTVIWTLRTPAALDWHPITWLSYALDFQLFGLNPSAFHIVNVLIHAINAVLLFLILEAATGLAMRSLGVAALFALHPINVESVAWIAERKTVLSMYFFLLALAAYGWYARRPGIARYMVVTIAYIFGLMSKAQVITFPFALLLLDYWPLGRLTLPSLSGPPLSRPSFLRPSFWKLIGEKLPWLALSAVSAVVTMKTGGAAFNYVLESEATRLTLPLWIRLGNGAISYVKYLGKTFWPANLALVYPHPGLQISITAIVLCAMALIALTTLAVIFRERRPFFVGWFWFLGTMVPMIGLLPIGVHGMADRYAYIPLLGIFMILCWGAADLVNSWHIPKAVAATGAAAILLALGAALHRQVTFWSDNVTLWTHTLQITERNFIAEDSLATALIAQGRIEEALPHLVQARSLRPDDPLSALNIATYQQMHGNYQDALDGYATVARLTATPALLAAARVNGGYVHYSLKQYDKAKQDFEAGIKQQAGNSPAYRGLGLVAQRAGDIAGAVTNYARSVELQPSSVGYLLLAQALDLAGQAEAARAAESQAARMTPDLSGDAAIVKQLLAN
jgi:protein O-mannosyl-transferase